MVMRIIMVMVSPSCNRGLREQSCNRGKRSKPPREPATLSKILRLLNINFNINLNKIYVEIDDPDARDLMTEVIFEETKVKVKLVLSNQSVLVNIVNILWS